jgi:hypothetical protein
VKAEFAAKIEPYIDRMKEGVLRVSQLLATADIARADAHDRAHETAADDILRAAVVLIHAHVEDFLRTLAAALLPEGDASCLKEIPLAGSGGKRDEKFVLGQLVQHKGKTVDALLRQSVSEHLDRRTFNNTDEIAQLLQALRIDVAQVNDSFPGLQQMMQRRHQVVHRADSAKSSSPTGPILEAINSDDVGKWMVDAVTFMMDVSGQVTTKLLSLEELAKKLNIPAARQQRRRRRRRKGHHPPDTLTPAE